MKWFGIMLFALACLAMSCGALDVGQSANGKEVPQAVIEDLSYHIMERGHKSFDITASHAETYSTSKRVVLQNVKYFEYNPDTGSLNSKGSAGYIEYNTNTEDAIFADHVHIDSPQHDVIVDGEYIQWIKKKRIMLGKQESSVTIQRGDGSSITGGGFIADANSRSVAFSQGAQGRVTAAAAQPAAAQPAAANAATQPAAANAATQPAAANAATQPAAANAAAQPAAANAATQPAAANAATSAAPAATATSGTSP